MSLHRGLPFALFVTFAFSAAFAGACSSTTSSSGGGGSAASSSGGGEMSSSGSGSTSSSTSSSSGGPGACRSVADCMGGDFCNVINLPPFCGGQCDTNLDNNCQVDADCANIGADLICDRPCKCWHGGAIPGSHCTNGCASDADCGANFSCNALRRCEPKVCAAAADCVGNTECMADGSGMHCNPKMCAADADCADFCVNGFCSLTLGACEPAVP